MTIENTMQQMPQPVGLARGPRDGSGPNGAVEKQLQQQQQNQQVQQRNQEINRAESQQIQNQQQIAQQVAMATGAGANINFTA
jgi:hypothetical protein